MTTPTANQFPGIPSALGSTGPLLPIISPLAPTSGNTKGPYGPIPLAQHWLNSSNGDLYYLSALTPSNGLISATWTLLSHSGGDINSLTGNTGGAIAPSAGNINIVGTGDVTVTGSGSTLTIAVSGGSTVVSSITGDTGTATPSSGVIKISGAANNLNAVGSGNTITVGIATSVAGVLTAASGVVTGNAGTANQVMIWATSTTPGGTGPGASGAVFMGNTGSAPTFTLTPTFGGNVGINPGNLTVVVGNIVATAGSVSAGTTVTAAGNISSTSGSVSAGTSMSAAGSISAGTQMTAATGMSVTNGNLILGTAGNKLRVTGGPNASIGTSGAMTGGTITISTTAVSSLSQIFVSANTLGGTPGTLSVPQSSVVAATSFVITSSSNTDTSTVNWWIVDIG